MMKIQNVQNNQWLLTAGPEGKANLMRGNAQPESAPLPKEETRPAVEEPNLISEHYNQRNAPDDELQVVYPPFFPIGNTQAIFTVLNNPKPENEPLKMSGADVQQTSEKVSAPLQEDSTSTEELSSAEAASATTSPKADPGSVLDLKA